MKSKTSRLLGTAAIAICFAAGVQAQDLPPLTADDLLFSVDNMDLSADPKEDFYRFAAGGWLDRVERPADKASYSFVSIQLQRITDQVKAVVVNAAEEAADAPKGSPTQLVGDFYTAYMDVDRRNANGMAPLQEEFDRIAAIDSLEELGRYSAHALRFDGLSLFAGCSPQADLADSTGMDAALVLRLLATDEDLEGIREKDASFRTMGVNSVPTFIVAGQHAVPGAQPVEVWRNVISDIKSQLDTQE